MEYLNMLPSDIKFLGDSGSKTSGFAPMCLEVGEGIMIDAGNIMHGMGEKAKDVNRIFVTHAHLDHLIDIPFMIDVHFEEREEPIHIYGLKATLDVIKEHIFNWSIWPDFNKIRLIKSGELAVEFVEIEFGQEYVFEDVTLKPIETDHTIESCGFVITKKDGKTLFTSDTYRAPKVWEEINQDETIGSVIVDISFPSRMDQLALDSKHLTPKILHEELQHLERDIAVYVVHIKATYYDEVVEELRQYGIFKNGGGVITKDENYDSLKRYIDIGHSFTENIDADTILSRILEAAIDLTGSDGGTIYLKENDELQFKTVINKSLGIKTSTIDWKPVPLKVNGMENRENVSALCAVTEKSINIEDVYNETDFNFDRMRAFDQANNYRSKSMLVIPMKNHEDDLIGVMQLINKTGGTTLLKYTKYDEYVVSSFAGQASVVLTKNLLIEDLEKLLMSFLKSIAVAMNEKSPYGYGHIERVAKLTEMITLALDKDTGIYKKVNYDKDGKTALKLAAWMHDIGKITTPEYVIDKATKLETIYDRIHELRTRFELVKSKLRERFLEQKCTLIVEGKVNEIERLEEELKQTIIELDDDFDFIIESNKPEGYMRDDDLGRIEKIAAKTFDVEGFRDGLLDDDECDNLMVRAGTLTAQEREIINKHAQVSYDMLHSLTFPKKFADIPVIAGSHHEKLNGKGYPLGLDEHDLPLEARVLALADIFEALTAHDRPYKKPKKVDEALKIIDFMVKDYELDPQLVEFFKSENLHIKYAEACLLEDQYLNP
jgi:HD-GYP domain-containing protein (c-di-GMP phosphodiesterase class II)/glyoxylase-like metal-dependent hydrolase (beta-lactamase superfamily II)